MSEQVPVVHAMQVGHIDLHGGPHLFAAAVTVHTPRENFRIHHSGIHMGEGGRYEVLAQVSIHVRKVEDWEIGVET